MSKSDFIDGILRQFQAPCVFNPWNNSDPLDREPSTAAEWRRARLLQHFDCNPEFLLIGEAPGYQGCHFSGVPFTNEALLMEGAIPRIRMNLRITKRELPWREPAATIVWRELYRLNIAERTVMWNAFAWHPHKMQSMLTNRPPTQSEVTRGAHVLRAVLDIFQGARIVAVGDVASKALKRLEIVHEKVRHPSMGGATQFRAQLAQLIENKAETSDAEER